MRHQLNAMPESHHRRVVRRKTALRRGNRRNPYRTHGSGLF